jgi:hypothetical protein
MKSYLRSLILFLPSVLSRIQLPSQETPSILILAEFESESYITIDSQSASLSWNKAPIWGLRPDFYYYQTVADLLMWATLSDERKGLTFIIAAGPRQRSHSRSEFRGIRDHILLSQI